MNFSHNTNKNKKILLCPRTAYSFIVDKRQSRRIKHTVDYLSMAFLIGRSTLQNMLLRIILE